MHSQWDTDDEAATLMPLQNEMQTLVQRYAPLVRPVDTYLQANNKSCNWGHAAPYFCPECRDKGATSDGATLDMHSCNGSLEAFQ